MRYIVENKSYQFFTRMSNFLSRTPHIHTHLEMMFLAEGRSNAILDGKVYALEQGDLFVAFPNQVHAYEPQTPVKIYLVIFSADMDADLGRVLKNKIPDSPVIKADRLPGDIAGRLHRINQKMQAGQPWDRISAKGQFLGFLGEILPDLMLLPRPSDHDSVMSILSYCAEHFTEPITLDAVAKALHLSKYYISHIITERMGVSFTKFLSSMRVEHACTLLDKGVDITDVCFSSGFASVRTFNRVFLEYQGVPPREYVKQKMQPKRKAKEF